MHISGMALSREGDDERLYVPDEAEETLNRALCRSG